MQRVPGRAFATAWDGQGLLRYQNHQYRQQEQGSLEPEIQFGESESGAGCNGSGKQGLRTGDENGIEKEAGEIEVLPRKQGGEGIPFVVGGKQEQGLVDFLVGLESG